MADPGADTAQRSLAHWSATDRAELEAFYALARLDYRLLAAQHDWGALLVGAAPAGPGPLRLLDVACGSGKWPEALLRDADLAPLADRGVDYELLDPAPFALEEAARALAPPLHAGRRHACTVQELDPAAGPYDVVWAVHALYALPPAELDSGIARMLGALRPGGLGVVAHASRESFYLRSYAAFQQGVRPGTPYVCSEDVLAALDRAGVRPATTRLSYDHEVSRENRAVLEGYLQRCLFDATLGLDELFAAPVLGDLLRGCGDPDGPLLRFHQEVDLILF